MQVIKYLTIFFSLLFSLNIFAEKDISIARNALTCTEDHNLGRYYSLRIQIEQIKDTHSNIYLVYNLAKVSLCLGETQEGIENLHKASNAGHIPSTLLLGTYHQLNLSFSAAEKTYNLINLDQAIHYFTKGVQMITSLSNYPEGTTNDMAYIESISYPSYYLFVQLPFLHFKKFAIAMDNIIENKPEVSNTILGILDKIRETSSLCLKRPALSVWQNTKQVVYDAQQIRCTIAFDFAKAVYPLEQERIQIAQNCQVPLTECDEHKKAINKIYQKAIKLQRQVQLAPRIPWSNVEYQQTKLPQSSL